MWVNAGVRTRANKRTSPRISGRLRNGQERANIPESEKTFPLNFAHSPPGNLCHTHVRIHQKKCFNPPQTSTTTKTAVEQHYCVPALDDVCIRLFWSEPVI